MYFELGCTLTVWVHWALPRPDGVAFNADEPECAGLLVTSPEPLVQDQPESPLSKPELVTRLAASAAPAEPEPTRVTQAPMTAAALTPAIVRVRTAELRRVRTAVECPSPVSGRVRILRRNMLCSILATCRGRERA